MAQKCFPVALRARVLKAGFVMLYPPKASVAPGPRCCAPPTSWLSCWQSLSLCVGVFSSPSGAYTKSREIMSQFPYWLVFLIDFIRSFSKIWEFCTMCFHHVHPLFSVSQTYSPSLSHPTCIHLSPSRPIYTTQLFLHLALHWKCSWLTRGYTLRESCPFISQQLTIANSPLARA